MAADLSDAPALNEKRSVAHMQLLRIETEKR
jgi:hypothetical protein